MREGSWRWIAACVVALALFTPTAAAAAPPTPFGHSCNAENGVLFCPTDALGDRVPSFDGAPLDVDVTLPAGAEAGDGPWPTIVMLHGYGGNKANFEATQPEGDNPDSATTYRYNNNFYAKRGYAVINYTARGFGRSCGRAENSNTTADCLNTDSYIHLADQRWEVRDTQYLLGVLADEGIVDPEAIGVTGISYGGGQSFQLAYLKDRVRLGDGSFVDWESPNGTPMEISAAWPRWPWSDLPSALLPNGRFSSNSISELNESRVPTGVPILSYITGLYALGQTTGTYCGAPPRVGAPLCTDPSADLNAAYAEVLTGEPVSPIGLAFIDELHEFHSGIGLVNDSGAPPPLLMQSGWTDDLFPVRQSLRIYNQVRSDDPDGEVALQFGDLGHSRGSNKIASDQAFNDEGADFFAQWLGTGPSPAAAPEPGAVTAYTQTCPQEAETDGPFTASSWSEINRGEFRFTEPSEQTITSVGGDPTVGAAIDPIANSNACVQVTDQDAPGTAVVRGPVSRGYTLLGLPKLSLTIEATGIFGEIAGRLWDVAPNGQQTLASRGVYRLEDNQEGRISFELHGNGYCFEAGHRPKLELLGRDAPYLRPSNFPFSVAASRVAVDLPTAERNPTPALNLDVTPAKTSAGVRTNYSVRVRSREDECARSDTERPKPGVPVKNATVTLGEATVRTNANGRASLTTTLAGSGERTARATRQGYEDGTDSVTVQGTGVGTGGGPLEPGDEDTGAGTGGAEGSATGTSSGGSLAFSGLEIGALVALALALLGTGVALRRRLGSGRLP